MAKLILKYRLGKRFTKMDNITMERMLQETDPDNQNIFRLHDSSVEDTQVDQTAAEDGTMELSSHVHSSGQCLPNDEIVMQYDAHKEESDYSKVAEGFVEVQPVDLPLSHNTFETLLTTARSTLEQITHLTYKFKDDGNLEEMSNWVDSLGHSLHQAQAFVIKEDGLVLQSTSISDPPTGESRPSECISSFQHPASGRVYCENTLQGFTYENCNPD